MSTIPLILFAKVPKAGQVKTRLSPDISLEQAAEVAKDLLIESLMLCTEHWPGKVVLAVWPDVQDPFIQQQIEKYKVLHVIQEAGDLGKKMHAAMETFGYPCAVMGCDVPHLSRQELLKAHHLLSEGQNVIGPTNDGGYYLLGLQGSTPSLFTGQSWGGEDVLQKNKQKAQKQKIEFNSLDIIDDIDTYQDLVQASQKVERLRKFVKYKNS